MEIRINRITLCNFKGVQSAEYIFGGDNARVEGPNGSGKSTIFDAFTWLLFGKDHKGQSTEAFELKTIDPATGQPIPRIDHWVEAELLVDGVFHTLRRAWRENWVKPTGETEEVMRGHVTDFFIDGVNTGTKTAYDKTVTGWMSEDMFKMLTNPVFFIDDDYTPWKARRKAVMDLVKDTESRAAVNASFQDVISELSGRTVDEYRKRLASEKSANKRDLESTNAQIAGIKKALPAEVDAEKVKADIDAISAGYDSKIQEYKDQIEKIDKALAGGGQEEAAQRKAENEAVWKEITAVQLWMSNRINEARSAANERNHNLDRERMDAKAECVKWEKQVDAINNILSITKNSRAEKATRLGEVTAELTSLGKQYEEEKGKVFEYTDTTVCPTCGQPLPAATIEEAREKARQTFMEDRKAAMEKILTKAELLRTEGKELKQAIAEADEAITRAEADLADKQDKKAEADKVLKEAFAKEPEDLEAVEKAVRDSSEFREKAIREQELRVKASRTALNPDEDDNRLAEKSRLQNLISGVEAEKKLKVGELEAQLVVNQTRQQQLGVIVKLEQQAKCFADAIAKAERLDARAADYIKADVDSISDALALKFNVARWKMFDHTLDGGLVEMCDVTSSEGVPYKSMNDAMKILCGMDVIRAFSEAYGVKAPIFIDCAESIICDKFDTDAQVIRLIVKDIPALTLTIEK